MKLNLFLRLLVSDFFKRFLLCMNGYWHFNKWITRGSFGDISRMSFEFLARNLQGNDCQAIYNLKEFKANFCMPSLTLNFFFFTSKFIRKSFVCSKIMRRKFKSRFVKFFQEKGRRKFSSTFVIIHLSLFFCKFIVIKLFLVCRIFFFLVWHCSHHSPYDKKSL